MRRLTLAIVTTTVLIIGGLGLQPASAAGYPPCTITGTAANEIITGTEGNDVICTGGGNDTVNALGGDDIIIVTAPGVDTINAGFGNDTIDATLGTDSTIDAGSGDDTIYGSPGDDEITAGDGNDNLDGNDGNDTINAGDGTDTVTGDNGNDTITGGDGNDNLNGDNGNDTITGDTGDDTITGGDANDSLNGTAGDDSLIGGEGGDNLNGGEGNDNLEGNAGNDNLFGEAGTDNLSGSSDDDIVAGGLGIDSIDGGSGLNMCDYELGETHTSTCKYDDSAPVVTDFSLTKTTVEVGSSSAVIGFHISARDDSGIAGVSFACSDPNNPVSLSGYVFYRPANQGDPYPHGGLWPSGSQFISATNPTGDGKTIDVSGEWVIPFATQPGTFKCYASTSDVLSNGWTYYAETVGMPSFTITRTGVGFDDSAPVVTDFSLTKTTVEVGSSSAVIGFHISARDDSGIAGVSFACSDPNNPVSLSGYVFYRPANQGDPYPHGGLWPSGSQFISATNPTGDGKTIDVSGEWVIPFATQPGTFKCYASTSDVLSNGWTYYAETVGMPSFTITRTGVGFDDSAPVVTDFSLTKTTVEVGSSSAVIGFHISARDDSGIAGVSFACSDPNNPVSLSGYVFYRPANQGDPYPHGGLWPSGSQFISATNPTGDGKTIDVSGEWVIPFATQPGTFKCYASTSDVLSNGWTYYAETVGMPSFTITRTPAGQPSSPAELIYKPFGANSGELKWSAPTFIGSPSLTNYVVEYSSDFISWSQLSTTVADLKIQVNGLKPSTDYWFRVRGENGGAVGQDTTYMNLNWAVIRVTTPAATAPAKPSDFASSNVTSNSFKLGWAAPSYNGGSAIADYYVEVSRNNGQSLQSVKSDVSTSTSLTVSGVAPGTTYLVRVAAVNAVGQSEWLMGSVTTLTTTATAPKNLVSSNLTGTSLSLGWGLPDSNGGSGITDYQVEVTSNGSNSWTVIPHSASNSLGFNVTNLLQGRTYQFRVLAVTSAGVGAASNIVTVTTLGAVGPNAPASLVVSGVKTNAASLSWTGVVATQKVSNYLVDVSTDGSTWISVSKRVSTSTSLALSGLKVGTSYQVRVAAVNSLGTGDYVYGSFTTLATVSTAPTALVSSNVSSSGFTLNWTAPTSNGGAAITDYVVEINGGGFSWSPLSHDITGNTSIAVSGLNPGIKYSVRVKAVNSVGASKVSGTFNVTTLPTAPGTVTGLTVKSVNATGAVVTWAAPKAGGSKISDYLAEYSTDNGQTWKTVVKSASSSTSLTLKSLKTKTTYLIRITANNSVGYGLVSQNLTVTTS